MSDENRCDDELEYITVNIEEIIGIDTRRRQINSIPLERITFLEDGKIKRINKDVRAHFAFTGLNNNDFILTGYYLLDEWPGNVTPPK